MDNVKWFLFFLLIFNACSEDDQDIDTSILPGKWKLIEQLADPGDGSGVFMPVNSEKTITFYTNETWASNGALCNMSTIVDQSSEGIYSSTARTITIENCTAGKLTISYELKSPYLILNYPCIEPCKQKYSKIE